MKIAIVGCGNIANTHAQELTGMGLTISVVMGIDTRQAEAFAKTWGIEEYTDNFDRVLDKDITTVHICTPPTLHYEMVKKVILAGKHVICEKPFCLKASEARELLELSKEKGTITAVNFNVRYHEACHRFRQKVLSPEFGNVYLIHGTYQQEFHVLPAEYMWRYQESLAGPMRATTEIGSHWIDLVRFLTGLEVNEVSATYGKFCPDRYVKDGMMYEKNVEGSEKIHVESDDAVIATLKFNNGALGCLLLSEITQGKSNYVSVEISGSSQSARWDSESPYKLYSSSKFEGELCETNAFGGGFPNTFSSFFSEVYKDMKSGSPSPAPTYPIFYDGYINAAICEAIYESANNNSKWTEVK